MIDVNFLFFYCCALSFIENVAQHNGEKQPIREKQPIVEP